MAESLTGENFVLSTSEYLTKRYFTTKQHRIPVTGIRCSSGKPCEWEGFHACGWAGEAEVQCKGVWYKLPYFEGTSGRLYTDVPFEELPRPLRDEEKDPEK